MFLGGQVAVSVEPAQENFVAGTKGHGQTSS